MATLRPRLPVDEVIARFSSEEQLQINAPALQYIVDTEVANFKFFAFALSDESKIRLNQAGIYVSPNACKPHSHPVCKVLENFFLFDVLPSLVDNSFFFLTIKNSKLDFLKQRCFRGEKRMPLIEAINTLVTSVDRARFNNVFHCHPSTGFINVRKKTGLECSPTLRDLLPAVIQKNASNLFLHDELHYWQPRELITFLSHVRPNMFYATLVFPPEILIGASESYNKWAYEFDIIGDELAFYPDGVRQAAYVQPLSAALYLQCKTITLPDGTVYNLDLIESRYCHHLILISKGGVLPQSRRFFGDFDAISTKKLKSVMLDNPGSYPVRYSIVNQIYMYIKSLKKPDLQSNMAKLRQLCGSVNSRERRFIEDFGAVVMKLQHHPTCLNQSFLRVIFKDLSSFLPSLFLRGFKVWSNMTIDDFMDNLKPLDFSIQLKNLHFDSNFTFTDLLNAFPSEDDAVDVDALFDSTWGSLVPLEVTEAYFRLPYPAFDQRFAASIPWDSLICQYLDLVFLRILESFSSSGILCIGPNFFIRMMRAYTSRCKFGKSARMLLSQKTALFENRVRRLLTLGNAFIARSHFNPKAPCIWILSRVRVNRLFLCSEAFQEDLTYKNEPYNALVDGLASLFKERCTFTRSDGSVMTSGRQLLKDEFIHGASPFRMNCGWNSQELVTKSRKNSGDYMRARSHLVPDFNGSFHLEYFGDELEKELAYSYNSLDVHSFLALSPVIQPCSPAEVLELPSAMVANAISVDSVDVLTAEPSVPEVVSTSPPACHETSVDIEYAPVIPILGISDKLVTELDLEIGQDVINLILTNLQSKGGNFLKVHMCSCPPSTTTNQMMDFVDYLHSISEACSAANMDICYIGETSGISKIGMLRQAKEGIALCLTGSFSAVFSGGEANRVEVSAGSYIGPASFDIIQAKRGSIVLYYERRVNTLRGQLMKHLDVCRFATVFEELFGLPVKMGDSFNPEAYNVFPVVGDGNCFWRAVGAISGFDPFVLKFAVKDRLSEFEKFNGHSKLVEQMGTDVWAEYEAVQAACIVADIQLKVISSAEGVSWLFGSDMAKRRGTVLHSNFHFNPCLPKNGCVIKAIAEALKKDEITVLNKLVENGGGHLYSELNDGLGLSILSLEQCFSILGLKAHVRINGNVIEMNPEGSNPSFFEVKGEHISFNPEVSAKYSSNLSDILAPKKSSVELLKSCCSTVEYAPDVNRARKLEHCLLNGLTGVFYRDVAKISKTKLGESGTFCSDVRKLHLLMGCPGSGKSYAFREFMSASHKQRAVFVSPRKELALQVKQDIQQIAIQSTGRDFVPGLSVKTFEVFLAGLGKMKDNFSIILDEIQLYPPGYVDFMLLLAPKNFTFFLAGDPCQSNYDSAEDRGILGPLLSDIKLILKDADYSYNILSRRFENSMFLNRLPLMMQRENFKYEDLEYGLYKSLSSAATALVDECDVCLVSSFEEKKLIELHFGSKMLCLTFGQSTGLTFNSGVILISQDSFKTNEERWFVALTRFRKIPNFVNISGVSFEGVAMRFKDRALGLFLTGKAKRDYIFDVLPGNPKFIEGFSMRLGKDENIVEEKLSGDPWLKASMFLGQYPDDQVVDILEPSPNEGFSKVHIPLCEEEMLRVQWIDKIIAKENRETRCGLETTEQFRDLESKGNGVISSNFPEQWGSIYPRHSNSDDITFLLAVKKRLRFSNPMKESSRWHTAKPYGEFLLKKFLKLVPLGFAHNAEFFADAHAEFEKKKTSKAAAVIANHASRSIRDSYADLVKIFMKSQDCTKMGNRAIPTAKAGQTLACFQHSVLCRFAPFMRYIEKKVLEKLPANYYIHSGKGLEELNEWVIANDFSGICTESDYEAFDSSQDHYIMAFEVALMRYLRLDEDLIADYMFIKMNLGSKLGNLAIMRFTGEASTFLFNTLANMLFTSLRYDLNFSESICFAGDDMCANTELRKSMRFESFLQRLRLKAKVEMTSKPTFCGWNLCPDGIYKKPQLVADRFNFAKEKGILKDCIDNYAIEVSFAYRLKDQLHLYMDEDEMTNHHFLIKKMIENKGLMRSYAADLFVEKETAMSSVEDIRSPLA
ncbi:putative RNA-dependent RNA polymerase [wheat yellow stunt associated betaflexivirus]|nr:putative RNA-dependent RNA polymerase [wheat yellow stunt associated betaflexivirus]